MFDNSSVMVMRTVDQVVEVYKLDLDEETRRAICQSFSRAQAKMAANKEKVIFDGSYSPNPDEFLTIESFSLGDKIEAALRNPIGLESYQRVEGAFPEIQAILVGEWENTDQGEKFTAAFQRFRKDQYILPKRFNLFFENNTFRLDGRFGISIADVIDCFFQEGQLQFTSYYFARQIFDLQGYYRLATEKDINSFTRNKNLSFSDSKDFAKMSDSWVRRKIAVINDSKVLEKYSAEKIKSLAKANGIAIKVENEKIVIPADKKEVKVILGFLDEEAYKGAFSGTTFLANSKRKV